MVRRVCVVTATRAEYGLLRPLLLALRADPAFELQLVVTGAHLSTEFGLTWQAIAADGFAITEKVEMLLASDSDVATVKAMGLAMLGFADVFARLQPELLVILGDRYEMFCIAAAATAFRIPIAHLHGGETTEGAFDEAFRHSISKMSQLHFAATPAYRRRLVQMGEAPERVFDVGAIGLDSVHQLPLLTRDELARQIAVDLAQPYFLVTYHPVTLAEADALAEVDALCEALVAQRGTQAVITGANADTGGRSINSRLQEWQHRNPGQLHLFTSLGQLRYLSAMRYCVGVVGNSSSGIIEAPSMHVGTLNIGARQQGREAAASVLHVAATREAIVEGLQMLQSDAFRSTLPSVQNPYGDGNTTCKIMDVLRDCPWPVSPVKRFYDCAVPIV